MPEVKLPSRGLHDGDRRDDVAVGSVLKWIAIAFVVAMLWLFAPLINGILSWAFHVPCIFCSFGRAEGFSGIASYYGRESGPRTASGQRFNPQAMTAAHRHLAFGTRLRVTHRGRSVDVTVNDRGPFIRGRVLDLSAGAARAIGLTGAGVGHVTAEVLR